MEVFLSWQFWVERIAVAIVVIVSWEGSKRLFWRRRQFKMIIPACKGRDKIPKEKD